MPERESEGAMGLLSTILAGIIMTVASAPVIEKLPVMVESLIHPITCQELRDQRALSQQGVTLHAVTCQGASGETKTILVP